MTCPSRRCRTRDSHGAGTNTETGGEVRGVFRRCGGERKRTDLYCRGGGGRAAAPVVVFAEPGRAGEYLDFRVDQCVGDAKRSKRRSCRANQFAAVPPPPRTTPRVNASSLDLSSVRIERLASRPGFFTTRLA